MINQNRSEFLFFELKPDFSYTTEKKIENFKRLGKGWCYGEGKLFRNSTINRAINLYKEILAQGFLETDAFPGLNGEIMITLYYKNDYLEFTIEDNGKIAFAHEKNDEEIAYEENLSLEEAKGKLCTLKNQIFGTSESYTKIITIPEREDLQALRLRTQVETEVSPLLTRSASYETRAQPSADISSDIIKILQEFPRYSGNSQYKYFLPDATWNKKTAKRATSVITI